MTTTPVRIGDTPATSCVLRMPWKGVWLFDGTTAEDVVASGRVSLTVGWMTLSGTVDGARSGKYRAGGSVRVVAGAGGWRRQVDKKPWHADNGVKMYDVVRTTATAVGETVAFDVPDAVVGVDFQRRRGPASSVLDQAGVKVWWVARDGVTHIAADRPTKAASAELLEYDPGYRTAVYADIAQLEIGDIVTIDGEQHTIRELRFEVNEDGMRTVATLAHVTTNRLYDALSSIVRQVLNERLWGLYRYRVYKMNVRRVNLQVVASAPGLPDVLPASMCNGVAGAWSKLPPGTVVLVEFIEGDVTQPRVTHFAARDEGAFVPIETLLDATDKLMLGPSSALVEVGPAGGPAAHRVGDHGTAGTLTGTGDPVTGLTYSDADGNPAGAITATADLSTGKVIFAGSAALTTKALQGSSKVKVGG